METFCIEDLTEGTIFEEKDEQAARELLRIKIIKKADEIFDDCFGKVAPGFAYSYGDEYGESARTTEYLRYQGEANEMAEELAKTYFLFYKKIYLEF